MTVSTAESESPSPKSYVVSYSVEVQKAAYEAGISMTSRLYMDYFHNTQQARNVKSSSLKY
jgi:hypothetical protein